MCPIMNVAQYFVTNNKNIKTRGLNGERITAWLIPIAPILHFISCSFVAEFVLTYCIVNLCGSLKPIALENETMCLDEKREK